MNYKRGLKVAAIFAFFGLISGIPNFHSQDFMNPFNMPGILLLRIFWSDWEIGHGGFLFNIIANPLCYAIAGFCIGAFTRSIKALYASVGILAVCLFSYHFYTYSLPKIRLDNRIKKQHQNDITDRLAKDPNDIYALHAMGVKHFTQTHKYNEAEKYFQKVVSIEQPKGTFSTEGQRCLLYLALIYQSWNQKDKAENYYQQFLATNPDFNSDFVLLNYNNDYLRKK